MSRSVVCGYVTFVNMSAILWRDSNCCPFPNFDLLPGTQPHGQLGFFSVQSLPRHGNREIRRLFNLIAIRGPILGKCMPGIKSGSSHPQSSLLPLRRRGGIYETRSGSILIWKKSRNEIELNIYFKNLMEYWSSQAWVSFLLRITLEIGFGPVNFHNRKCLAMKLIQYKYKFKWCHIIRYHSILSDFCQNMALFILFGYVTVFDLSR